MIKHRQRDEKITKMKLQTAKVLWQEGRKDATFLLLESVNDPRGDDLRERMGFAEDYEVGLSKPTHHLSSFHLTGIALFSFIFFVLGLILSPNTATSTIIEAPSDNTILLETSIPPTSASDPSLSGQLIELTATSNSEMSTASAFLTQEVTRQAELSILLTARYDDATATTIAATQAAGN